MMFSLGLSPSCPGCLEMRYVSCAWQERRWGWRWGGAALTSVPVQVFGRRDADTIHALLQPASKKRTAQLRAQTSELDPNPDIGRTTTRSPVRRP